MAKYDSYSDDPYPPPGDLPGATASKPGGLHLVRPLLIFAVVGVVGVVALYFWAQLFICDLWGPLFHGRLPGAFGRFCR